MSDEKKIYVGSGKKVDKYDITNISICLSDLPKEFIVTAANGKKYINLAVSAKREPDQYGKTHSVSVNTYKKDELKPVEMPKPEPEKKQVTYKANKIDDLQPDPESDDLPF